MSNIIIRITHIPGINLNPAKDRKQMLLAHPISDSFAISQKDCYNSQNDNTISSWNEWFGGSPSSTVSNSYSSSITQTNNLYVTLCVFIQIIGSISMNAPSSVSLLAEECSFIDCRRNNGGGAIYFNQGLNCVLHKICASQCNITYDYGQFCYIQVASGSQYKNIAHLMSVCKCAQYNNNDKSSSMYFYYGNISLNNVNSSANICYMYSGVLCHGSSASSATYSTICNNTDVYSMCISFYATTQIMSQSNIIRNHQKQTTIGIIYNLNSQTTLSGCIIDMNTGATNIIYINSGTVAFHNCFLQTNMQTFGNPNIQSPISDSLSLILNHFNSHMCLTLIQNVIQEENAITSYQQIHEKVQISFLFIFIVQII